MDLFTDAARPPTLSPASLGSIAKVSVPVRTIIPWSNDSMFVGVVALRFQHHAAHETECHDSHKLSQSHLTSGISVPDFNK